MVKVQDSMIVYDEKEMSKCYTSKSIVHKFYCCFYYVSFFYCAFVAII